METDKSPAERIRFGSYEVDLAACELRKAGMKLRLQPQPFQVLRLLLERPGEVVTRDELKQELWPDDTYVEFDLSLNTVIKKLRGVLQDNPQHPRYVETLPRNGYRFIFPVERIGAAAPDRSRVEPVLGDGSLPHYSLETADRRPVAVFSIVSGGAKSADAPLGEAAAAIRGAGIVIPRRRRLLERTAALLGAVLVVGLVITYFAESPGDGHFRRWSFPTQLLASAALSPDGKHILFAAQSGLAPSLWIRSMDQESPRRIAGTEGASIGFWSPDSQFVAFAANGHLKKVSLEGGSPVVVCPLPNPNTSLFAGGSWSPDGEIVVFSSGSRLYQAPSAGGAARPLLPEDESLRGSFQWPHFLPSPRNRRAIVYAASTNFRDRRMEALDLVTGERRNLGPGSAPVYSPEGYLIYGPPNDDLRGLMALPFSLETLEPVGDAFHLNQEGIGASVSHSGDLVYWDNPNSVALHRLTWVDRATGRLLEPVGEAQFAIRDPAISPDGERVLVSSVETGDANIYVHDIRRSTKLRLTSDAAQEAGARWSPDGANVVFWRQSGDETELVEKPASSAAAGTVLHTVRGAILNLDWSRDGRYLVMLQHAEAGLREIRYISAAELSSGTSHLYSGRPSRNASPRISPNGRYLAYESRESGSVEVFVGSFPDGSLVRAKVSTRGGRNPQWNPDGTELFYLEGDVLMAVSVQLLGGEVVLGSPRQLFSSPNLSLGYAPSRDGQRFLTVVPVAGTPLPAIHVVENWHDGLGRSEAEAGFGW